MLPEFRIYKMFIQGISLEGMMHKNGHALNSMGNLIF